jgi:hypothetical protein
LTTALSHEKLFARVQAAFETGLILLGLLAMFLFIPHGIFGDGAWRFRAISQLIKHGTFLNLPYSLVGPLFAVPLWWLGKLYATPAAWCEQYNLCLFAFCLLMIYVLLKDRVDHRLLRTFFLVLITASMFAAHIRTFYGEVFTAVTVGLGILALLRRFSAPFGWIAIILGVVNTPASLVGLGLAVLKHMLDTKRLRYVLALLVAGGLVAAESWLRRGGLFTSGYEGNAGFRTIMPYSGLPGFSYPFFFGLLSILFSFGKGLLFFTPGLLLPVRASLLKMQQERKLELYRAYMLWICFVIGLILVYSRWWAWYGGVFWGPRFFLFASLPASFALAVRLRDREVSLCVNLLTLVVLCLSTWVGIAGAVFDKSVAIRACIAKSYALEILCHYTPEFSVLWHPFVEHQLLEIAPIMYIIYCAIVFAYLAVPLLLKIVQQTLDVVLPSPSASLDLRVWRW